MNKIALMIVAGALAVGVGIVLFGAPGRESGESWQNVEVRDGVQFITIRAKGGYSPRLSEAKAGIPTKLIVETSSTYDCSAALVIRAVGYQKILPPTGQEVIDLGTVQQGTMQGLCSMGMYNFSIKFK